MHAIRTFLTALLLAAQCVPAAPPQTATAPTQRTERKASQPYTGDLSIFDSPGRDERLQINRIMEILGIDLGKSVADVGAGSGWFTVRAARRVGEGGTVFAVDINPEAVRYIEDRTKKENVHNAQVVLSKPDDPMLLAHSVDAVLMLKTYHEFEHPITLMRNLRAALRPGARVGIIDRDGNGENHGVNRDVVIRDATEAGYRLVQQLDWKRDGMDYLLVFSVR